MVNCPNCGIREIAPEIRMFGVLGPKSAVSALPLAFVCFALLIWGFDYFRR